MLIRSRKLRANSKWCTFICRITADHTRTPVVLFKMLLIGYLFGIQSERRQVQAIVVNVAYRWFLGLKLTDPVAAVPPSG